MSSPITFSGFNDIDFSTVLTALMNQASQPLNTLQTRQRALQTQITSFDSLQSRVAALRSAAAGLDTVGEVSTVSGTSSSTAVHVSAGPTAVAGRYDVVVNELARAQVTVSTSTLADSDTTAVATGGSITIGGTAVAIGASTTLQGLADAINNTAGIGVTATVVRTGAASHRLALTSTLTGQANAFTVTNALTGGAGVTFGDSNGNGVSGDSAADNAVTATDASILINNIAATSSTNTFSSIVAGVTLTVSKKDPATTVTVDIAPDGTALKTKVTAFITAYNETVSFLESQRVTAGRGEATSIGRDPLLRQLRNSLRTELLGPHGTAAVTRLSEVGVEFTRDGRLELDQAIFDEAVATQGNDLRQFFGGAGGAFPAVTALLDGYTNAVGFISSAKDRLNKQIDAMDDQIAAMQVRLALQRDALQRQFTEADAAMSRLRNQSASLANLGI